MSFFTDLVHGNFSNLGEDLNPSNIFSDTTKDIGGKNTIPELLGGAALLGGGLLLGPELLGGAGAATAAADTAATAGGLDTALGFAGPATAAADTSGLTAIDTALTGATDFSTIGPGLATATGAPLDLTAAAGGVSAPLSLAAPAASTAATPSFLSSLETGAVNSITKNQLGLAIAGGGLAYDLLQGNKTDPNQQMLQNEAPQLLAQGTALSKSGQGLQTYLTSGTLPPALQAQVTQSVNAAKATIIANAAHNGQNTDPTQNSQLAADLAAADQNGLVLAGQLEQNLFTAGTQLLQTGVNETGLSNQLYETLVNMDRQNNQEIMTAIAGMASALGGGTKIQIGTGGTTLTA